MKTLLPSVGLCFCLSLTVASCSSGGNDSDTVEIAAIVDDAAPLPVDDIDVGSESGSGILDALRVDQPNFKQLVGEIMASPELVRLLNDESKSLTLFAPNDAAFSLASAELGSLDAALMNRVLRDHVLPFDLDATQAMEMLDQPLATVGGTPLTVSQADDGSLQVTAREGDPVAMHEGSAIATSNGTIYFIDRMMPGTIPEAVSDDPAVAAASATGVIRATPALSDFAALLATNSYSLTLADPMNSAFIIIAPTNGNLRVDQTAVSTYLQQHIINRPALGNVLVPGDHLTTANTLITVAGTADALTIGGASLTLLAGPGTAGGSVYQLDGELPGS